MTLDPDLRKQLVEARERIIAQLDELEFRVTGQHGAWRRRAPQDATDAYGELKLELREINELLGLDADDESTA
jgi:hypothetical protein